MANWGSALSGALSGAATGAGLGSFIPGVGNILGGIGGGLVGGLTGYFSGKSSSKSPKLPSGYKQSSLPQTQIPGYESGQLPQYTPEQMQLFNQMFSQVGSESYLSKLAGGAPEQFAQLEAPALKQFGEIQGGLASRFSGMGTGARHSSGFQNVQSTAAQDFAQQLQAQRLGLQRQALGDLSMMSHQLLGQRPFEQYILPREKGFWESFGTGLAPGIGQAGTSLAGLYAMKKMGMF